jgi:hypothetical protein
MAFKPYGLALDPGLNPASQADCPQVTGSPVRTSAFQGAWPRMFFPAMSKYFAAPSRWASLE